MKHLLEALIDRWFTKDDENKEEEVHTLWIRKEALRDYGKDLRKEFDKKEKAKNKMRAAIAEELLQRLLKEEKERKSFGDATNIDTYAKGKIVASSNLEAAQTEFKRPKKAFDIILKVQAQVAKLGDAYVAHRYPTLQN